MPNTITKNDFKNYVKVQHEGRCNMFDPNARKLTGLSKDKYNEIIRNYDIYEKKFSNEGGE